MKRFIVLHESRTYADGWLLWLIVVLGALVLALALAPTAAAATAYISLVGDFFNAGDQLNVSLDLNRSVSSTEALRFETFTNSGGTNAAGDNIPSGGIDSIVELFDSGNISRGVNDDFDVVNQGRDSLLTWPGSTPNPSGLNTPLTSPLAADHYRLNLRTYGNTGTGPWALDLLGPEDAMVITGLNASGTSTISTLKAGYGAQVNFNGSYELNGGKSFTFQSGADFTVGSYLDIGNATSGSLILRNPGSTLITNTTSSTFLDWGQGGGLASVVVSDQATANILANYINIAADPSSIGLLTIESGADMTINGLYLASSGGLGQVDVRGAGSTLTQNGASTLTIGSASGLAGLLSVSDSAVFASGSANNVVNPTGQIRVNGATFNANGSLTVGATAAGNGGVILENQGQINSRDVIVGTNLADGSVLINGFTPTIGLPATWNVTGSMRVVSDASGHGSAVIEQAGRLQISDNLSVGSELGGSNAKLTVQTGSQVTVGDELSIGNWGEVKLLGGEIHTHSFDVPPMYFPTTQGQFTHKDGTLTVDGGSFRMGDGGLSIDSGTGIGTPTIKLEHSAVGSVRADPDFLDGFVHVGWQGQGRLEILSGASLTSNAGIIASSGQNYPNSSGQVLVQGDDSLWQITGNDFNASWLYPLVVGQTGTGTLEISAGGHVVSEGHVLIGSPGTGAGRGTAIVDGADSLLRVINDDFGSTAQLSVGVLGASLARGSLTVSNSGRVEVDGELVVEDAGSVTLTSDGEIHTGSFAVHAPGRFTHEDGTLTVDGGTFNTGISAYGIDGADPADLPVVKLMNGATAAVSSFSSVNVGEDYRGRLEILSGSQMDSPLAGSYLSIGCVPGSEGEVIVDGPRSALTTQSGVLVGLNGRGVLRIRNGGSVSDPASAYVSIAQQHGSVGIVEVAGTAPGGTPSTWTTNGILEVGRSGHGTMTISAGGRVDALGGADIAANSSAGGSSATVTGLNSRWAITGPLYVGGTTWGAGGAGTLTVANDGQVTAGNITVWQPGTVALNSAIVSTGNFELAGGTLQGNGAVLLPAGGSLHNAGLVSPGLSAGVITVSGGNYVQDMAGTLAIEIGGTNSAEFDRLNIVSGTATLAGTLDVSFIDLGGGMFAPNTGNSFEILTAAGGLGGTTFDSISFPDLRGGLLFGVLYNPTDVTLVVEGVLGDYNRNGVVDAADYVVWRKMYSGPNVPASNLAADGDGDHDVDQGDFAVWRSHFGQTAGSGALAASSASDAIPEPATLWLAMLGVTFTLIHRLARPSSKDGRLKTAGLVAFVLLCFPNSRAVHADTFGSEANAFTIDFVGIGNAGNRNDAGAGGGLYSTPYGGVDYAYRLGVTEVPQDWIIMATNLGMTNVTAGYFTGSQPAVYMTWYECAAFVNWLNINTGHQPAYELTYGPTPLGVAWSMNLWGSEQAWQLGGQNLYRHKDAYYFLPSEDEWYKGAYHQNDGMTANYWDYATGSNTPPTPGGGTGAGKAWYNGIESYPTLVESAGGASSYGTRGQNGNVWEWNESAFDGVNDSPTELRGMRGGAWGNTEFYLRPSYRSTAFQPQYDDNYFGFRVASVPEPLPGDYNLNGAVDAADYIFWRKYNNTSTTLPNDSTPGTDQTDYDVWRAQFGQTAGSGAGANTTAAVPEPATVVMLMFATVGWCLRRGRAG